MAASNSPEPDTSQVTEQQAPAEPVVAAPSAPVDNTTIDLQVVGRPAGDAFVSYADDGSEVRVGTEASPVTTSLADKIIADARAVGVTIERVVKDVAEKVEG